MVSGMRYCSGERRESPLRRMDPPWRNYADYENYGRHDHHAARQDPEADTVNIRAHATGRNAIINSSDAKSDEPKGQKRGHVLSPLGQIYTQEHLSTII